MNTQRLRMLVANLFRPGKGSVNKSLDLFERLITVQVILPQSKVGIENLITVEPADIQRAPLQLVFNAFLPVAE